MLLRELTGAAVPAVMVSSSPEECALETAAVNETFFQKNE